MAKKRHDLDQSRLQSCLIYDEFQKSDHFSAQECANEHAPVEERCLFAAHRLMVAAVMPRPLSLKHGRIIVDLPDRAHQCVVEWNFLGSHTLLLGLAKAPPRGKPNLLCEPFFIC